mmetsp:Transcript_9142/g.26546  ORF Transcript_9142/g.26546 Transcript_9142/m.26546 type:complete len:254 (-) Transcript_9142:87-848(-)
MPFIWLRSAVISSSSTSFSDTATLNKSGSAAADLALPASISTRPAARGATEIRSFRTTSGDVADTRSFMASISASETSAARSTSPRARPIDFCAAREMRFGDRDLRMDGLGACDVLPDDFDARLDVRGCVVGEPMSSSNVWACRALDSTRSGALERCCGVGGSARWALDSSLSAPVSVGVSGIEEQYFDGRRTSSSFSRPKDSGGTYTVLSLVGSMSCDTFTPATCATSAPRLSEVKRSFTSSAPPFMLWSIA